MRKIFTILISVFVLSFVLGVDFGFAKDNQVSDGESVFAKPKTEINFFYSAICPHCKKEKEFLKDLETKYPEITVKEYEVFYNSENKKILNEFYERYQVPEKDKGWVPVTFTENKYFIGFNSQIASDLETCVKECLGGSSVAP